LKYLAVIDMYDKITQALDENKYAVGIGYLLIYLKLLIQSTIPFFEQIRNIWNKRILSGLVWQLSKKSASVCLYLMALYLLNNLFYVVFHKDPS